MSLTIILLKQIEHVSSSCSRASSILVKLSVERGGRDTLDTLIVETPHFEHLHVIVICLINIQCFLIRLWGEKRGSGPPFLHPPTRSNKTRILLLAKGRVGLNHYFSYWSYFALQWIEVHYYAYACFDQQKCLLFLTTPLDIYNPYTRCYGYL